MAAVKSPKLGIAILMTAAAFLPLVWNVQVHAQRTKSSQRAGEQVKAERGLKDNRYFFYFVDSSISNFGTEDEKRIFKEAIRRDILAQLLYMRFQFHEAYTEIRKSQSLLVELYGITLKRDITMTKSLLDEFAPRVIESQDVRARSYLRLGYRNMKSAGVNMVMGDHYREKLFSMRLNQYVKAIKLAKEGRRYALLAGIEQATPQKDKRPFGRLDFDAIEKEIARISASEKLEYYRLVHRDNYYRAGEGMSFYDTIWENPAVQDLEEYREYLSEKYQNE